MLRVLEKLFSQSQVAPSATSSILPVGLTEPLFPANTEPALQFLRQYALPAGLRALAYVPVTSQKQPQGRH
jgi:hypothetical protein